ncbi:MAG: hypothetical protein ACRYFK_14465 [Janthinobacterium lividum]
MCQALPLAARAWKLLATDTEARKRKLGLCARYGCLAPAGAKKKYCPRHHHQALKQRDPISYIYSHRKQRAKARGHEWTITLANFRDWCQWTGYHLRTGRTPGAASIDRRDPFEGYHCWNLDCIPYGANSAKHTRAEGGSWHIGADGKYHYAEADACPF